MFDRLLVGMKFESDLFGFNVLVGISIKARNPRLFTSQVSDYV